MLVISGPTTSIDIRVLNPRFNLAIEMLVISGHLLTVNRRIITCIRFNLAIEMLVISG